jgi:hypothetical protein
MRLPTLPLFAILTVAATAQTAPNQDCAHAVPLPVSAGNVAPYFIPIWAWDLTAALPDPATACSGSNNHGSAWYSFVATASKHWVREEGDGLDESSLEVFSGTCGSLTSILCMPSNSNNVPLTGLSIGSTYYVRVIMPVTALCPMGTCFLSLAVVSDPVNDECAGAIQLPVIAGAVQPYPGMEICTLGATQSQAACTGNATAANDDVWCRFTATQSAHHFVAQALTAPGFAITSQWFSGACGALTSIACNASHASGLIPGQEYHIRTHTTSTDVNVTARAMVGVYTSAANDECSGAIPITVATGTDEPQSVQLSTWLATSSTVPCGTSNHDVWLSFVPPTTSVTFYASETLTAALFNGSCGSLNCIYQGIPLAAGWTLTNLTVGATYWLSVGSSGGTENASIKALALPENDDCTNAVPLGISDADDIGSFTFGHANGATGSTPPCSGGGQALDVWYSFTATATTHTVVARPLLEISSVNMELFSGSCGSLTSTVCAGNATALVAPGLVPGSTYYLRVSSYIPTNTAAFRIGVVNAVPNDECDGAITLPFATLEDFDTANDYWHLDALDGTSVCAGSAYRDVWFKFTAAHTTAGLVVPRNAGIVEVAEVLSGTCGALTSLGCVSFPQYDFMVTELSGMVVGTEYFIRVVSGTSGPTQVLLFDQPVNDEITGALNVPVGGSPFAHALFETWDYGATESYAPHCGAGAAPDEDTWFTFTATATAHTILAEEGTIRYVTPTAVNPLRIEVYDTLSTDNAVLDANVITCGNAPLALTGLVVGHDYWYRAYTATQGTTSSVAFNTAVTDGDNDEANGALALTYGDDYAMHFNTNGATQSLPGTDCSVDDFADDDIWFKFTATNAAARLVAGYATADLTWELFSGTPGNLTSMACDGNILVLPALTAGQTYYARLYSWRNAVPVEGWAGLFTTPSLTANACVDEDCLGPVLLENPSIEQGDQCLPVLNDPNDAEGLGTLFAPGWPRWHAASADGYGSCNTYDDEMEVPSIGFSGAGAGRLLSRSGRGMAGVITKAGLIPDYKEYIQAALTEPLIPGEPYLVSFHVAERESSTLSNNGFGAVLTQGPLVYLNNYEAPVVEPQVLSLEVVRGGSWTNICGVVIPDAPWDNISIGVFLHDLTEMQLLGIPYMNQAYYFIDDVVVAHIDDASCITGIGDVPPLEEDAEGSADDLRVYPNPANDLVNIVCGAGLFGERAVVEVFDVTGKLVYAEQVASLMALQPVGISAEMKEGLYLLMVRVEGQEPRSARVVVRR